MSDTIPRHSQAVANLANKCDDPAIGADNGIQAATDGAWLTSSKKNMYMNESYRWIVTTMVEKYGVSDASVKLQGLIATQSITLSASGVTLNADYMYPISLYKASASDAFNLAKRESLDNDYIPSLSNFFVIEANKLYAYVRTAGVLTVQASGSTTFYYLKADRVDTSLGTDVAVNTAPDTTIDRWALDACSLYAAGLACAEKSIIDSSPEWAEKGFRFTAMALARLPQ